MASIYKAFFQNFKWLEIYFNSYININKTPNEPNQTKLHSKTLLSLWKLHSESETNDIYNITFLTSSQFSYIMETLGTVFYLTWYYKARKFSKFHMLSYLSFEIGVIFTLDVRKSTRTAGEFKNCYLQLWEPPGHPVRQLLEKEWGLF